MVQNVGLTEKEAELVQAIRNFKKSRHNPSKHLEKWAIVLFENLMYDDEESEEEHAQTFVFEDL